MTQIIIIPHQKRTTRDVTILDNGEEKTFEISFDRFKSEDKNEDPFIWNDNFLYTFCHGNDVFTKDLVSNFSKSNLFISD